MSKKITHLLKELYIEGKNISEICEIVGISRPTFYAHRRIDEAKNSISWDELVLAEQRTDENIRVKEAIFLNSLFKSFDKFLEKAKTDELSEEVLERLHIYARTYYNLKAPKQIDEKELKREIAGKVLLKIKALALQEKNEAVARFLSEFSSEIVSEILKIKNKAI